MSIWVVAYCQTSAASTTPADMAAGIAKRLALLTYLFCPEDEEAPDAVLKRLRIENASQGGTFQYFHVFYRREPDRYMLVDRLSGDGCVEEVGEEIERLALIGDSSRAGIRRIREALLSVQERVAFELKLSDANGMGWPLAIAAAAWLVERNGGIIRGEKSWMAPTEREVEFILDM